MRASWDRPPRKAAATKTPLSGRASPKVILVAGEQLGADILQHPSGALNAERPGQNGVFVLDAENALVADVHVRLDDGLPQTGAVAVANGAEGRGSFRQIGFLRREVEHSVFCDIFGKQHGV